MSPKESAAAFNEMDSNCNACADFQRLPHEKEPTKFVRGRCGYAPASHPLMYRKSGNEFWVHPADFMGMDCWAPRLSSVEIGKAMP
jgi:hypothetical protein